MKLLIVKKVNSSMLFKSIYEQKCKNYVLKKNSNNTNIDYEKMPSIPLES